MHPVSTQVAIQKAVLRSAAVLVCAALWFSVSGCGPRRAKAVNVELAKTTLIKVLDHWKSGGKINDLQDASPKIVVQELNWTNGKTLQDFALIGEGWAEDANWYCEVELTFAPKDGDESATKKVTYVVGTDPVLTVFRAIL